MKLHKELAHRQQFLLSRKRTGKTWLRFLLLLLLSFSNSVLTKNKDTDIYTHTWLSFEDSFVELIRSRSEGHDPSRAHTKREGWVREVVGRDCQWISLSNAVSELFENLNRMKKKFQFSQLDRFYFRYSRRVDLLCERGSLWKRFWINLIFFKCRFRVIEFGSHEKGISVFSLDGFPFFLGIVKLSLTFARKRNVSKFFSLNILSKF